MGADCRLPTAECGAGGCEGCIQISDLVDRREYETTASGDRVAKWELGRAARLLDRAQSPIRDVYLLGGRPYPAIPPELLSPAGGGRCPQLPTPNRQQEAASGSK